MNGLPYYKRYPRDFFEGTIGMPLELKGPYALVLDLIYMQNGKLLDDPRYVAGLLGCGIRQWNSIRDRLLAMGKIERRDGYLGNFRADKELDNSHSFQEKQRENGRRPKKNNNIAEAVAKPEDKPKANQSESEPDKKEERGKPLSRASGEKHDACIAHFNAVAARVGWAQVQRMTPARQAALSHRIEDIGGQEAWRDAIDRAARSPLLTGQTGRGWRADFDWLCKTANFTKLCEGNYDPRPSDPSGPTGNPHQPRAGGAHDSMVAAFAAVASGKPN